MIQAKQTKHTKITKKLKICLNRNGHPRGLPTNPWMRRAEKSCPDKEFIPAPPEVTEGGTACGCNECNYMRLNTLEKVYNCLRYEYPQVEVDAAIAEKVIKPIERMLALSEKLVK